MKVTLHGVRGSLATPQSPAEREGHLKYILENFVQLHEKVGISIDDFIKSLPVFYKGGYGGNTACTEVTNGDSRLIIDTGTGIRNAMGQMTGEFNILMTHFHWDHILGLPFFVPMYIKGNKINFYAVQDDLEEVIRNLFKKPYFPVPFEVLESTITFNKLEPRKMTKVDGLEVTPYLLDHPDPCWGFKISNGEKNYAHCVDNEALRRTAEELGEDLPLYQDIDLMLFDAQYSIEEAEEKKNWGHASAPTGLEIAVREKVKKIIFTHHDPVANDEAISKTANMAVKYFETSMKDVGANPPEWAIAIEGRTFDL